MMKFFANDFTQDRWRKAALKNAFALLSKQRFEHAAAFFLLAGELWDAVEVCISRLHDLQLGLVITRMYEGDNSDSYNRLLKEKVLGISHSQAGSEPSSDPFLRSMSLWLLQDYSGSLETLIVDLKPGLEDSSKSSNAAIFNFYFYLRSHPLLIRRGYPTKKGQSVQPSASVMDFTSRFHGQSLSGVGDELLTPTERNLVFTTAYHHLNSGSPLLALIVMSKLPKSEDLGLTDEPAVSATTTNTTGRPQRTPSVVAVMSGLITTDLTDGSGQHETKLAAIQEEEDTDWSQPISMQAPAEEDEFDWSKPVAGQLGANENDEEFDWSKPVSSQVQFSLGEEEESNDIDKTIDDEVGDTSTEDGGEDQQQLKGSSTVSPRGLFIVSLAEQLQYNALLSILTEELVTIHIPSCCTYLWETHGKDALPLLPLNKDLQFERESMVEWFEDEAFERILPSLQMTLVDWLRSETQIVKDICEMEVNDGSSGQCLLSSKQAAHAGYDLLTTLLNYTSLHAGTVPSMIAVKTELMHLMNTLQPWSTGLAQDIRDGDYTVNQVTSCAISPTQLPMLTSCSLPAKHPLNLSLQIKLLSASIFNSISSHTQPPNIRNPIQYLDRVFELCMSLSHCISMCLTPMRLQQGQPPPSSVDNLDLTDSYTPTLSMRRQRAGSGSETLDVISSFDQPKSRPSKWPGLPNWPDSLLSDDGKEASPLCLILMEALVVVYVGLLTVAWSKHSIYDLLMLLGNVPSQDQWPLLFGGGILNEKKSPSNVKKKPRKSDKRATPDSTKTERSGLYVAPKKSLLKHCLTKVS